MTRTKLHPQHALWLAIRGRLDAFNEAASGLTVEEAHHDLDIVEGLIDHYGSHVNGQVESTQLAWAQEHLAGYRAELEPTPPVPTGYRIERQHISSTDPNTWTTVSSCTDYRTARQTLRSASHTSFRFRLAGDFHDATTNR